MRKNTAVVNIGRLLEVRVAWGYRSVSDVDALFNEIAHEVSTKVPFGKRVIAAVDWRLCPMLSTEASDRALERMTRANPRTERSAALASSASPATVLQFLRLVRESQHPDRKLFFSEGDMTAWLDPLLTSLERARLRDFLRAGEGATGDG